MNKNKAVLVVDDESAIRRTLNLIFRKLDFTVIQAESIPHLERVIQSKVLSAVDLRYVFTDINLTDDLKAREGLHVIKLLVEAGFKVPVIAMSGDPDNAPAALEAGAKAFLAKPFGVSDVLALLNNLNKE